MPKLDALSLWDQLSVLGLTKKVAGTLGGQKTIHRYGLKMYVKKTEREKGRARHAPFSTTLNRCTEQLALLIVVKAAKLSFRSSF